MINYLLFLEDLKLKSAGKSAKQAMRRVSPAMLYELARLYDEWPGEDYEGSSCRGALIWFCKDPVTRWYKGAENFVGDLEDQVRALKARLK